MIAVCSRETGDPRYQEKSKASNPTVTGQHVKFNFCCQIFIWRIQRGNRKFWTYNLSNPLNLMAWSKVIIKMMPNDITSFTYSYCTTSCTLLFSCFLVSHWTFGLKYINDEFGYLDIRTKISPAVPSVLAWRTWMIAVIKSRKCIVMIKHWFEFRFLKRNENLCIEEMIFKTFNME